MEQFNIPPRMGVPCRRRRKREGGACRGHTCERDFAFTWQCLNRTVERSGMLATFVRCVLDKSTLKEVRARRRLAASVVAQMRPPSASDLRLDLAAISLAR